MVKVINELSLIRLMVLLAPVVLVLLFSWAQSLLRSFIGEITPFFNILLIKSILHL